MDHKRACQILEVSPSATSQEIRNAYRKLAKAWHPDRFHGQTPSLISRANMRMQALNSAYELLMEAPSGRGSRPANPERSQSAPNSSDFTASARMEKSFSAQWANMFSKPGSLTSDWIVAGAVMLFILASFWGNSSQEEAGQAGGASRPFSSAHPGIDIHKPMGTPVFPARSGRVIRVNWRAKYGPEIILLHANGEMSRYAALSKIHVKVGDDVNRGKTIIGQVGVAVEEGNSPHLHFEIRAPDGTPISPTKRIGKK